MIISDFIHTMTFINIFLGDRYFCILTYILSFALNTWGYSSGASGKKCAFQYRRYLRDTGSIPRSGRSSEEGMATYSSVLAWRIPWTEVPGRLQSMGSQRVRHD